MNRLATSTIISAAALLSGSVPAFAETSALTDLGNVMFVGDSITHGVNSASYRWELHKILVDNGISYNSVGYKTANYSGGVAVGEMYGGVSFNNVHSSQASARAWELAGVSRGSGGRFDYTNILNWLGLSSTKNNGGNYTGDTYKADTFFMLIGTNDLLSDNTAAGVTSDKVTNLLGADFASGDMKTIVDAMYKSNESANVTIFSIPAWTTHANSNGNEVHAATADYNNKLKTWVTNYNKTNGKNITYVDVNVGLIDVASETPFFGCSSMFNKPGSDGLHPNAQGDLIIAGNVAKALGYAGRTAGQDRRAESDFASHITNFASIPAGASVANTSVRDGKLDFSASGESTFKAGWDASATLKKGYTVDFSLNFGNGGTDGWDTTNTLNVTVGDDQRYGVLKVSEAYIQWGDTVLYSTDMSQNKDALRISYVVGNAAEGLTAGFYVWLDDMLIGQGLKATDGSGNRGVTFSYAGSGNVLLESFSMDGTGSYAPDTTRHADANGYHATSPDFVPKATPQGQLSFPQFSDYYRTGLTASGEYSVQDAVTDKFSGGAWTVSRLYVSGGNATRIYANSGDYAGFLYVDVQGGSASSWYGAHTNGNFNGDVTFRLSGSNAGGNTVFGAVNAGTVSGGVFLDLSASGAIFSSFTDTGKVSVAGAYNASIAGTLHLQISTGTFKHDVIGGLHTATNGQYIGQTKIFVNGGTFQENIYGGGIQGAIGKSLEQTRSTAGTVCTVTVTGGIISGAVYGGGFSDTINGNTSVSVTGGTISKGIYGGGSGGTINGNTQVTIDGNIAQLRGASNAVWSAISGGGIGGTISGNSTVTLKNVSVGNGRNGMDRYAGSVDGGSNVTGTKTLILENVTVKNLGATFSNFDVVNVTRNTSTSVSSIGGASVLNLESGTSLSIAEAADLKAVRTITMGANASLALDFKTLSDADEVVFVVAEEGTKFSILAINGIAAMDLNRIKFKVGEKMYAAEATIPDTQAGTVFVWYSVPEPSAFGLLAGACGLGFASVRRRRH